MLVALLVCYFLIFQTGFRLIDLIQRPILNFEMNNGHVGGTFEFRNEQRPRSVAEYSTSFDAGSKLKYSCQGKDEILVVPKVGECSQDGNWTDARLWCGEYC